MSKMRLREDIAAWIVGANKKITVPKSSEVEVDSETNIGVIIKPPGLEGTAVKLTGEIIKIMVDVEAEDRKAKYVASLDRCLNAIYNFENLPEVDSGTPLQHMRDLGKVTDWLGESSDTNAKLLRHWLHHMNMKIPHPSLSVEKARFPDSTLHFVLVLTQTW